MKRTIVRALLAAAASAPALMAATPASALTINFIDQGGVNGSPAEIGFKLAALYWQSVITNDVTMNINVKYESLGPGILGSTGTSLYSYVPIDTYYSLLAANGTKSTIDNMALASLPGLDANGSATIIVPDYFKPATQSGVTAGPGTRVAPTDTAISSTIAISSSNVKALLNNNFDPTSVDADISFSSDFNFDFNASDGITAGYYDFVGVAIHEIGHALGFLSGAQDFDYSTGIDFPVDDYWWGYAADMFRNVDGDLNWAFNKDAYFSLDGGATAYLDGYWSTGDINGDGWQASHWKAPGTPCANLRGIMNPYICGGLGDDVKALDLALLDAIGWNTKIDVDANKGYVVSTAAIYRGFIGQVPEPATWLQMIGGFALLGGAMRLRARKVAFA